MPHQCTGCGHTFDDGSKEMLSGCPDCGGKKFQFEPNQPIDQNDTTDATVAAGPTGDTETVTDTEATGDTETVTDTKESGQSVTDEDSAQVSARSDMVDPNELPETKAESSSTDRTSTDRSDEHRASADTSGGSTRTPSEAEGDDAGPDLSDLREELNDQFESIKILNPGQYELNLMELYDRQEQIISLQEDGRYVIEMPNSWRDED